MGRTACTEPQCLYKGALYLTYRVHGTDSVVKQLISTEVNDSLTGRIACNQNRADPPTQVLSPATTPLAVIIPLPQSSYLPTVSTYRKHQN